MMGLPFVVLASPLLIALGYHHVLLGYQSILGRLHEEALVLRKENGQGEE